MLQMIYMMLLCTFCKIEKRDGKYYEDGFDVMDGINNEGWWDGPARYKKVNRNVISWVQHDLLFHLVNRLAGKIGADIGGPSGRAIDGIINVNLYGSRGNCIIGRGERLPFKNESLDYLISSHTLEHIKNTESVLKEWLRVLKVGGFMAVVMPDKRFHLHDPNVTKDGDAAYSEMEPSELLNIIKTIANIEILSFNTFDNNFDFEFVIRKS